MSRERSAWWEQLLKALGFNPVQLRWRWHRYQERKRRKQNERENSRRVLSYEHKLCPGCGLTVDRNERQCPRCEQRLGGARASRLGRYWRHLIPEGAYTCTGVMLAANVAFYLAMLMRSGGGPADLGRGIDAAVIFRFGAAHSAAVLVGAEYWRLATAMLLHFDLLHLIFNSLCLVQLGPLIEGAVGRSRYMVLYFVSGVVGFVFSAAAMLVRGPVLSAGASGVVFGLIAAGLVLGYVRRDASVAHFRQGLVKWLVLGVIISVLPGVDLMAHAGGAAAGAGLTAALIDPAKPARRGWRMAELLCLSLLIGSVIAAWLAGQPAA